MSNKPFSKKIHYLYEKLNYSKKEFTNLFWDGDKKKFASRHTTVHKSWLGKGIEQVKGFDFDAYEISNLKMGEETVFTEENFMYDGFEVFKERVDKYVNYKFQSQELFEYKYIYYFDANRNQISFYKLDSIEKVHDKKYIVELIPPKFYTNIDVSKYLGVLRIDEDRYHISVKNSFEILTFYFMRGRSYKSHTRVNGIGLGRSYAKGLPRSSRALLTKENLTEQEESSFYLHANESEYLMVDEDSDDLYSDVKSSYLKRFHHKLNNLETFIRKSKRDIIVDDVYLNIFYQSFFSFNAVSKKIAQNQNFVTPARRTGVGFFLNSMKEKKNTSCTFVYPAFKCESILFDKSSEKSKELLASIVNLSKKGLKIQMIFIINFDFEITKYFQKSIERLIASDIDLKIAFNEDIKVKISSYDFIYSKEGDVAIYTNMMDRIRMFKVTKIPERIKTLTYDFKKIKRVSFSFDELLIKKDVKNDKVLEQLTGEWHYYAYGSLIVDMKEFRLWHSMVSIHQDGTAHYKYKNMTQHSGNIDTKYNPNQSYIRFTNHDSKHLALVMIDHHNIHKNIFKVTMMRKQFGVMLDMAQFGIFSRKELDENLVKKALGNTNKTMLRENIELEKRINELYIESKF